MSKIPPPILQMRSSCGGHSCHSSVQVIAHILFSCALDGLLQPVSLDSASSSCCCTFSSNFGVAMAEQLCSNPCGTALFKAEFRTTPPKRPKNDQNLWVGSAYGTKKPPSGKPSFSYGFVIMGSVSVYTNLYV